MSDDLQRAVGRIEGKLDMMIENQEATSEAIENIDGRLRKVEKQAVINGSVAGGLVSIGMTLAIEKLKTTLGIGG